MQITKKEVGFTLLGVAVIAIAIALFGWKNEKQSYNYANNAIMIDTVFVDRVPTPLLIRDTIKSTKYKHFRDSVFIPIKDSAKIRELIAKGDSIEKELRFLDVGKSIKLDTLLKPYNDTLNLRYDILNKQIDLSLRYSARKEPIGIQVVKEKGNSFFTPLNCGLIGFGAGLLFVILVK